MNPFLSASRVLEDAIRKKAFPAASIEVGDATRPLWRQAFGRLRFEADAPAAAEDTIFDLASLTKVLATTPLVMQQTERGAIGLDDPVREHVAAWQGADRAHVTVRDLLAHCAGLAAYLPFHRDYRPGADPLHGACQRVESPREGGLTPLEVRAEFEGAICRVPLEYAPRTKSVYSDLGFMLLGFILER
ncbi:MAG: beta-lactamase, partial [Acidobacteria bacterium]|nr:beta-lactamase [Acidobacteriota bacterium]